MDFNTRIIQQLRTLRRPKGNTYNLLSSITQDPAGSGYIKDLNDKPLLATFRDNKTNGNFSINPDFQPIDIALKLRKLRNAFRNSQIQ